MKSWTDKIYAYALKNAVEHDGKAQTSSVVSALFHEGLKKEEVKDVIGEINKVVNEINKLKLEEQKDKFDNFKKKVSEREVREGLPELPNAKKGKVVLRFAPYPSGPLHIGNARPAILNDEYAKMYKGKLLLIIDDTIGSKEKQISEPAYKLIPEGLKWLKVNWKNPIIYKSDRLNIYYKYAEELIKKGKAYVCSCSQEKVRKNRAEMRECLCRQYKIEENLKRWKKMFKAKEGEFTLRIKTSMQDKNPAFRDRILFRISDRAHPKTGKKYRVWPMLEFSWAVDDYLLGITHIIRGKELRIESEMEKFIWDIFGWKHLEIIHSGLLQIKGIKISKSKGQEEVKAGRYFGWDDPRTWSLQSLEKRGIQVEALREFILGFGINENEVEASLEVLYAKNREIVHEIAEKITFDKTGNKNKSNAKVIIPDGKVIYGNVMAKLKEEKVYHLLKLGYCRLNETGKVNEFWFAHP